jgi:hypothetical protein
LYAVMDEYDKLIEGMLRKNFGDWVWY